MYSISINLVQLAINEINIHCDLFLDKKHALGLNVSSIYANPVFDVFILSSDQGIYPGAVYKGVGGRLSHKYYYSKAGVKYIAFQVLYKNLYYRDTEFRNAWKDNSNNFVQSEDAFLVGIDLVHGKHIKTMSQNNNVELFYGLGFRYRDRHITISKSEAGYFPEPKQTGTFSLVQRYPVLIFGVKFGYTAFIKRIKAAER